MPFHFGVAPSSPAHKVVQIPAGIESKADLLSILSREIPMPTYFGFNWDSLEECLGDLTWFLPREDLALVHADVPLAGRQAEQKIYVKILAACSKQGGLRVIFPEEDRDVVRNVLGDTLDGYVPDPSTGSG